MCPGSIEELKTYKRDGKKNFIAGIHNYDIISNDRYWGLFQYVPMELRQISKKYEFAMKRKKKTYGQQTKMFFGRITNLYTSGTGKKEERVESSNDIVSNSNASTDDTITRSSGSQIY